MVDYASLFSYKLSSVKSAGTLVLHRQTTRCDSVGRVRRWLAGSHRILISLFINNFESCLPLPVVMVHPLVLWYYFFLWPFHKPAANGVKPKKCYKYTTINLYLDHCSWLFLRCSSVSEYYYEYSFALRRFSFAAYGHVLLALLKKLSQ